MYSCINYTRAYMHTCIHAYIFTIMQWSVVFCTHIASIVCLTVETKQTYGPLRFNFLLDPQGQTSDDDSKGTPPTRTSPAWGSFCKHVELKRNVFSLFDNSLKLALLKKTRTTKYMYPYLFMSNVFNCVFEKASRGDVFCSNDRDTQKFPFSRTW